MTKEQKTAKVDLSEFFKYSKPKRPPCKIGFVLTQLETREQQELELALEQDKNVITGGAIEKWLEGRDLTVSINQIASHRNGKCTCCDE